MNTKLQALHRRGSAAIRLLGAMLVVWMLGAFYMPAVAQTTSVTVDQQPLTVQQTIPPNVVLMLDDSGSMAWDYMPDACYLYGVTCTASPNNFGSGSTCQTGKSPINNVGSGVGQCVDKFVSLTNQALIDSSNNGVYYNPAVIYTPPPAAKGPAYGSYSDITSVPVNGFSSSPTMTDITKYSNTDVTGEYNNNSGTLVYGMNNTNAVSSYDQTVNSKTSKSGNVTYADQVCTSLFNSMNGVNNTLQFIGGTNKGTASNPKWASGECKFNYMPTYYYFQYSTGPAAGPYTTYYVAPAAQGCGTQANCVKSDDTSGIAAPAKDASGNPLSAGTNIANWFAYYHTRILMAKSGLMTAFSTVDPNFRVGFGSIDSNGSPDITSLGTGYYDTYNSSQYIAFVRPFGDGSSGTQKDNFWTWAKDIKANNGTPLRQALDSVGQYYQTAQPWTTMSTDPNASSTNPPVNIACRQSYTILTTDGFWNESNPPSIANVSNQAWPTITGPNGQTWPTVSGSKPGVPYSGGTPSSGSGPSLADVALYYWENDLANNGSGTSAAPKITNEVPTNDADPAFWQHMVTFTMGLGFTPTGISGSATVGTTTDSPPTVADIFSVANGSGTLTGFSWPTPASNSLYNISDLAHAGVNGHGGFYSATSPAAFTSGLTDALNRAASRVGSGASLAANSTQLTSGTVAYQASYHTVQWAGDLVALSIDSSTGAISATSSWSASTMLLGSATVNGKVSTYPNRTIMTYVPGSSAAGSFVPFINSGTGSSATPPSLSTAQLTALGASASDQAAMVNYLRGDNTLEKANNGTFRTRVSPLGDIVDSQPVYAGAPNPNEFENQVFTGISNTAATGDNSFLAFAVGTTNATTGVSTPSAASKRTPLVYVAANDGMLHAFNASTGTETYAYLPGAVITAGIKSLSDPAYGAASATTTVIPHQYYNDGELTIADAYFGSAWHTVLVGTTGRGLAEAVYALDITDPGNITPLWERSTGDGRPNSKYIGQMVGKPVIAKVQDNTANSDWQVLIGNGYNSSSGVSALLEFNLATGDLNVHTTDTTPLNGLAAPVTWMNDPTSGISTKAYAGDLAGHVWSFPLSDVTTTPGTAPGQAATNTYTVNLSDAGTKIFTATDAGSNPQPITAGMLAGRDPITSNVWLFFGTGEYLNSGDTTTTQVQSWYGLIVQVGNTSQNLPSLPATTLDGSLVQRSIIYEQAGNPDATPPTVGLRAVTPLPVPSDMAKKLGWYMNLVQPIVDSKSGALTGVNDQGERMVTPNQFQGNLLLGTTRIPQAATNADICNSSGSGWVMAVDPFTGTNPSGPFFLANGGDGRVKMPDGSYLPAAGVGFSALPNNPIFVGGDMLMSFDNGTTSSINTSGAAGLPQRVSWKELVNP